jgi:hypothetical protein
MIMDMATIVVEIAAATLFVDFAIDPMALAKNQPVLHKSLTEAWNARHNHMPSFMTAKSTDNYVGAAKPGTTSSIAQSPKSALDEKQQRQGSTAKLNDVKVEVKDEKSSLLTAGAGPVNATTANTPIQLEFKDLSDDFRALLGSKPVLTKYPQSGNRGFSHSHTFECTPIGGIVGMVGAASPTSRSSATASQSTASSPPAPSAAATGAAPADLKLSWKSDKFILLSHVTAVHRGAYSEKLKSETSGKPAHVVSKFFCVLTSNPDGGSGRAELNLEADSPATAERWVKGFEALIKTLKSRKGAASSDSECCCVVM